MRKAVALLASLTAGCAMTGDDTGELTQAAGGNAGGETFVLGNHDPNKSAPIDRKNPYFASLGTNGRTCESCHAQAAGWTVTPSYAQQQFAATHGTAPLFRLGDGAVSPTADVSTEAARKTAYAMLLTKGLIRVGIGIPPNAEFRLIAVDDPYGFASAAQLSLFRRPLPIGNAKFLTTVMWDGRESTSPTAVDHDLMHQATDATLGHAQATTANPDQMEQIAGFEQTVLYAQKDGGPAGPYDGDGATGGAKHLATQAFYVGINDPLGANPTGAAFDPHVFNLFDAWAPPAQPKAGPKQQAQYAIYRGQQLFNSKQFKVSGVKGLNDQIGVSEITATCSTCHDSPNLGHHSVPLPIDIGISDPEMRTPDMPLYTLQNLTTGEQIQTTDPGRALITGKWADINKFKGPLLRGAASRAPYFHNGSAATLRDVVNYYDGRFSIGFTPQEIDDLVAFLQAI
jgi:cytochrome c peroxidase